MKHTTARRLVRLGTAALVALGVSVAMAPAAHAAPSKSKPKPPPPSASRGYDVSYPQCGQALPSSPLFGIVGVNRGIVFSANPCASAQLAWAQQAANHAPGFYANTGNPGPAYSSHWPTGQTSPQVCDPSAPNSTSCSFDYGWNAAQDAFAVAVSAEQQANGTSFETASAAASQAPWWLDVETTNSWQTLESAYGQTPTSRANDVAALDGAVAFLQGAGVTQTGFYSTTYQWTQITGGTGTHFAAYPAWIAGYSSASAAQKGCAAASFTGGPVKLTQYPAGGFDADYACP